MAFKELSQKEQELLTDQQREMYEKEHEIYRERVRFVEQLEKMEHVTFESFQPTLKPITPVSQAPEMHVKQQREVRIQALPCVGVHAPAVLQFAAETVKAELPATVMVAVPDVQPKKTESVKAHCAPATVISAPTVQPIKTEEVKAKLPTAAAVSAPAVQPIQTEKVKAKLPTAAAVSAPAVQTIKTEEVKVKLPTAAAPVAPAVQPIKIETVKAQNFSAAPVRVPTVKKTLSAVDSKEKLVETAKQINIPNKHFEQAVLPTVQVRSTPRINIPTVNCKKQEHRMQQPIPACMVSVPEPQTDAILHLLLNKQK